MTKVKITIDEYMDLKEKKYTDAQIAKKYKVNAAAISQWKHSDEIYPLLQDNKRKQRLQELRREAVNPWRKPIAPESKVQQDFKKEPEANNESTEITSVLMKNFEIDAGAAIDLLKNGLQRGANISEESLNTLSKSLVSDTKEQQPTQREVELQEELRKRNVQLEEYKEFVAPSVHKAVKDELAIAQETRDELDESVRILHKENSESERLHKEEIDMLNKKINSLSYEIEANKFKAQAAVDQLQDKQHELKILRKIADQYFKLLDQQQEEGDHGEWNLKAAR